MYVFDERQSKQFAFNLQVKTLEDFLHTSYIHTITFYFYLVIAVQNSIGEGGKCMSAGQ